jgi:hypothetical protein
MFSTRRATGRWGVDRLVWDTQAANMSKYEESPAASAFMDLHDTAAAVATLHNDVTAHVDRCTVLLGPRRLC